MCMVVPGYLKSVDKIQHSFMCIKGDAQQYLKFEAPLLLQWTVPIYEYSVN
jgi:hypothetical protein